MALTAGHIFPRALHGLHFFPRSATSRTSRAFNSCTFSRALHGLHFFPRSATSTTSRAINSCTFSRALHRSHFLPRSATSAFSLSFNSYTFFRALHRLHFFFSLHTGCTFSRRLATACTGLCQFHFIYFCSDWLILLVEK